MIVQFSEPMDPSRLEAGVRVRYERDGVATGTPEAKVQYRDRYRALVITPEPPPPPGTDVVVEPSTWWWTSPAGGWPGGKARTRPNPSWSASGSVVAPDRRAARSGAKDSAAMRPPTVGAMTLGDAAGRALVTRMLGGASLRLDRDTRLEALSSSSVWLERGGVYVGSEGPASSAALRIRTREGEVADVGTQFQVRAGARGVQVSVREGQVFVFSRSGRHDASAGTRLDLAEGDVRRSEAPGHGPDWAWVESAAPEYDMEGRTLEAFLRWVSRETGLGIRFEDPSLERSLGGTLLHGSSRGLTASEAVEAVLPASGLVGRQRGGTLWIAREPERGR